MEELLEWPTSHHLCGMLIHRFGIDSLLFGNTNHKVFKIAILQAVVRLELGLLKIDTVKDPFILFFLELFEFLVGVLAEGAQPVHRKYFQVFKDSKILNWNSKKS